MIHISWAVQPVLPLLQPPTSAVAQKGKSVATTTLKVLSSCSDRNTTSVPRPLKHITWQDGLLQPCKQESVCPTSGRREVRTVTDSLQPWFSYWSVTDKMHQTVHNLSDGDDRIQWGVGTQPPFSTQTPEHTQLFSFLFGLSGSIIYHLLYDGLI